LHTFKYIRTYFQYLLFFCLCFYVDTIAYAQNNAKLKGDFYQTKAPTISNKNADTLELIEELEQDELGEDSEGNNFNPHKAMSIVSEDTAGLDEGEMSIVEVAEQLKFDTTWVTYAEYFSIWDSKNVNPYRIDGSKFNDTLNITLYDSANNFYCAMPLDMCKINSVFGMRHSRWHYGIDLDLEIGQPVYAAFDGMVRIVQYDHRGYGYYVMLRHYNGFETLYGHLTKQLVKVGQLVKAGEIIGLGGSTGRSSGPHLHFEVRYEGNPIDPEFMYDFPNNRLFNKRFQLLPSHFEYLKNARKVYYHRVKSGQTLSTIARKYRVSVNTLYKLNRLNSRSVIRPGRKIRIR
jgi:hypothetical protein